MAGQKSSLRTWVLKPARHAGRQVKGRENSFRAGRINGIGGIGRKVRQNRRWPAVKVSDVPTSPRRRHRHE